MPAPNSIRTGPPRQREDHPPKTRKGLPIVKQVLEKAKEVDFDDKSSRVAFLRDFKDRVGGDKKAENELVDGEVFHELAKDPANFRQYEDFIKWAFARNSKLLECRTKHDDTPLLLAIEHQNHGFVELVLDKVHRFPRLVGKLLQQSDQVGLNCLHKAIMSASPFTESIIAIMRKASTGSSKDGENTANDSDSGSESEAEMTTSKLAKIKDDIFTAKSRKSDRTEGWTALHFAVQIFAADQQLTDNEEEFREAVSRRILQQPISRPQPGSQLVGSWNLPISDPSSTHDKSSTDCTGLPPGCKQMEPGASSTTGKAPWSYASKDTNGTPTEGDRKSVYIQRRDYCQLTIVRELIKANPKALLTKDKKKHTPFQLRLGLIEQEAQQGEGNNEQARQPNGVQQRENEGGIVRNAEEEEGFEGSEEEEEEEEDETADEEGEERDEENEENESNGMGSSKELRKDVQSPHMLSDDSTMRGASARQYEDKPSHEYVKEVQLINDDEVLSYIREYVIDNFDRRTAMMALYKVGCERTIEFDLSGLPYKSINKDFFTRLGNVLHFEGRLKYVALPRLTVENDADDASGNVEVNHQRQTDSMGSVKLTQRTKGLQHMCTIFEWLKGLHVKSILKVTVMDDAELSHSDEAIETCMKGLDVRVWNWRRVDLCIDVISFSAPNVTDVTLYSSGNNAVLVGWSSKGGLPKLKELRKVRIYVREGLDTQERFKQYRKAFESKLKKHKPNVKVSWGIDIPTQDLPLFARSSSEKASREPKWMKTMKQFATFLRSVKPKTSIAPIKIAIIDDGIDSTLDVFSHRIQTGESFYKAGSGRWQGAYYVPTGYHGTLMAQLICDICPVARLYIAQLEPVPRNDGRRGFTQQSAIEAINWAVNRGVDIISMSWSIDSGSSNIEGLDNALKEAVDKKIVMFCSSIDEGPMVDDNTYPGRTGHCIKIGASTGDGARLSWVSANNSDFLLPGDESVHVKRQNSGQSGSGSGSSRRGYASSEVVPAGGSSISTALAAGLAGVLIYCDRLTRSSSSMAPGSESAAAVGLFNGDLQSLATMRRAFKTMAAKSEDHKFLRVWKFVPLHWESSPVKQPGADRAVDSSRGAAAKSVKHDLKWNTDSHPKDTEETRKVLVEFLNKLKVEE